MIELSIRTLAEFLLKSGSIDSRFSGLKRAAEGSRIHCMLQKQGGKNYKAEVPLEIVLEYGGIEYRLSGRADGVIENGGQTILDEIKTITRPLGELVEDEYPAHWAQACLYAHILCARQGLGKIVVQLTYFNPDDGDKRIFSREYTALELEKNIYSLLEQYHKWAVFSMEWKKKRDTSLRLLKFPFDTYRVGQRDMAIACYNTFKNGQRLFCCAPTGIGKTVSALFPAMKSIGEGYGERIFYLTAKTIARTAAEEALLLLRSSATELQFKSITLTAKDKLCFLPERDCRPEACPYAEGYYDRINEVLYNLLSKEHNFTRESIEAAAKQNRLCPYELALDLSTWCDCVICDYNYLFDPVVHLQRFFEGDGGENLFLIDEAHNLPDRSRAMYSAYLNREMFFTFKKSLPKTYTRLHTALKEINSVFVGLRHQCEQEDTRVLKRQMQPEELKKPLEMFIFAAEDFLDKNRGSEWEKDLLALYFEVLFYNKISEGYNETYTTLVHKSGANISIKLFCMHPAPFVNESLEKGRAAVLFSATLLPLPYYREVLGSSVQAKLLNLQSPFLPQNLGLFIADRVNTRYNNREASCAAVVRLIFQMFSSRKGNYIAYFPSYAYMRQVAEQFEQEYPGIDLLVQQSGMDEQEREAFLGKFSGNTSDVLLGFCVMGGIFSEGIDLVGERLIGTAIVGVGLPQIGPEPDALRQYYDEDKKDGFSFAYQFPGMNKVMQAAGRVIRSENDRGVVLLIDDRFVSPRYKNLFPKHWMHWQTANTEDFPAKLLEFWGQGG